MKSLVLFSFCLFCFLLVSCDEAGNNDPKKSSTLTVRITDSSPKNDLVEKMEVVISKVEAIHNGETVELSEQPSSYDLQELGAGLSKVIVEDMPILPGNLTQLRVHLDSALITLTDGSTHSIRIPSEEETGVKLVVSPSLSVIPGGVPYELVINFDLSQSLMKGESGYMLRPVIRVANKSYHGDIIGKIYSDMCSSDKIDHQAMPNKLVKAYQGERLVAMTSTNGSGDFALVGLKPGGYEIVIEAELHKTLRAEREVSAVADARISARLAGKCVAVQGSVFSDNGSDDSFGDDYPIDGAIVNLYDANGRLVDNTVSASDGSFKFAKQFEQPLEVVINDIGHYEKFVYLSMDELYDHIQARLVLRDS